MQEYKTILCFIFFQSLVNGILSISKEEIIQCIDQHPQFQRYTCSDQKTKGMSKQDMKRYIEANINGKMLSILKRFNIVPTANEVMKSCGNEKQDCITYTSAIKNGNCLNSWIKKKIVYEFFKCDTILKK